METERVKLIIFIRSVFLKKCLTMAISYAIIFYTCRRAYFFVQKIRPQYERREAKITGGAAK